MRSAWLALGVLALVGAALLGTLAVGQIHHDNGCSQLSNALRGTLADPVVKPSPQVVALLPVNIRVAEAKSEATYNNQVTPSYTDWQHYSAGLVGTALAESGC